MSIHSDVGVCIRRSALDRLSKKTMTFLASADDILDQPEGVLYHFKCIKWYHKIDADIVRFYKELDTLSKEGMDEDFLVLEACLDYPIDDSDADRGNSV